MAEAEYSTTAALPLETVWDFVSEMDNWAAFVAGYQSHRKESDIESVWVLKGDLGAMARRLEFRVQVTEWSAPHRVRFRLEGLNEPMQGEGRFELELAGAEEGAAAAPPRRSPLRRLAEAVVRFFLRLFRGAPERAPDAGSAGPGRARLRFWLRLEPGGPMAPMVNAMIKPVMLPAAEELANRIMAELESRRR